MKLTILARKLLLRKNNDLTFFKYNEGEKLFFPQGKGLYIHIPFCKNNCPFCPYNKIPYNKKSAFNFKKALIKEIELYSKKFKKECFDSIYFGGGTPTLLIDNLKEILDKLKGSFVINGSLGIEVHPNDVSEILAEKIKKLGFNIISLGIQSFQKKFLNEIGRNYDGKKAISATKILKKRNFETFNIDLMFVLNGQNLEHLKKDLETAVKIGIDQITCYPFFTFPYSSVGKIKKLKKIKLPNFFLRKRMYYFIYDFLKKNGYHQSSVWSFNKNNTKAFSSVTRNYYLGLGPGSASYNGKGFYFNTFNLNAYIKKINNHHLPIALKMEVNEKLEKYFWLYWRLYETIIPKETFNKFFNKKIEKYFYFIIRSLRFLHFIEKEDNNLIVLNKRGSYWIHLAQNYFALDYISKIWSICQEKPWPKKIKL